MAYKIRTNLLTPVSVHEAALKPDCIITIDDTTIVDIKPCKANDTYDSDQLDCLAIPGLIDLHVHLSQHRITGSYRDALLPWLNEFVFPEESKSAEYDYAHSVAEEFFTALYKAGTTTAVIYTAPGKTACEAAFEAAALQQFRAFIGMTLMDQNSPANLQQNTQAAIADCLSLIEDYHSPETGLQYILTPRFAPTCSMELMQWVGRYARENKLWIQTHLSENKAEIAWVKDIFGLPSYTAVYEQAGILTEQTILAHCLHLTDEELNLIKSSGSVIAHCPDSNFFLRSGMFPLQRVCQAGIPFALGSDVGAGTTLNMLYHAKMYNFRQSEAPVTPADAFHSITLGSAAILGLDHKIGSLEIGKEADIVLLRLPHPEKPLSMDILSELVFTGHDWANSQVYSKGTRKA